MAITYLYPPTNEPVKREQWRWVAIYKDGEKLHRFEQFEISGGKAIFHRFDEIDADRLIEFRLEHDTYMPVTFAIPAGAQPVHFYRHRIVREEIMDNASEEKLIREQRVKLWCIGFKLQGNYWLAFVDEYDKMVLTNNHALFSAVHDPTKR